MKKSDLETIIKKIQNRCYLESPTKVTYYWNEDHKIVFKIFFESLYLPKELRIDKDDIQNTFVTQNVYEYEDDFTILELNQNEGYIKVLPDDQNFKIVHNYREANKEETVNESKRVHLATKNLKEAFAESKGYILQEVEKNSTKISVENSPIEDAKEKEEKAKKVEADVYVISVAFDLCKEALDKGSGILDKAIQAAIDNIAKNSNTNKAKLLFAVPNILSGDLKGTKLVAVYNFTKKIKENTGGDTYAYLAEKENQTLSSLLADLDIKNTYFLTTSAETAIKQVNYPNLLKTIKETDTDIIEDTTVNVLKQAQEAALKCINLYKKDLNKKGGVHKDFSKKNSVFNGKENWDKRRKYYNDHLTGKVNAAITFCMDLYGNNASDADKAAAEERKNKLQNSLDNAENIGNTEEVAAWYEQAAEALKNSLSTIFGTVETEVLRGLNSTAEDNVKGASTGMIKNGNSFGGATAGLKKADKVEKKPGKKSKSPFVTDYFTDFPIKIAIKNNGKDFRDEFKELLKFFSDAIDAKKLETETEELKKDTNNETDDEEAKNKEQKDTDSETDDEASVEETDDAESSTDSEKEED